jgi:acid phosphatase (class A)
MAKLFGWSLAAVACAAAAAAALAQAPMGAYLSGDAIPQTLRALPPPPKPDSAREADDRAVFAATRALAGQPRWTLATADADLTKGPGLFACAIGLNLTAANAPTLATVFRRTAADERAAVDPPKDHYGRKRPYLAAAGDPAICVDKSASLAASPSYPSGHSTLSWAWGLILAELAPDRATDILMRARSIGESRVVCGVHYPSDVDEGRTDGAILVAALHGDPAFRADMDKARAEVAAARAAPHAAPGQCAVQDDAAAHPPY